MGIYTDFKFLRTISIGLRNYREIEPYKVNFSCPICGDSKHIKWKARGYVYVYQGKSFYKCQNCGVAKSFSSFLRHMDESAWRSWRTEIQAEEMNGFKIAPTPPKNISVKKERYDYMTPLLELSPDHECVHYVKSRLIPVSRYRLLFYTDTFNALVNEIFPGRGERYPDDARLVIPTYNQKRELIAISGRSITGAAIRYSTAKSDDQPCFFGVERADLTRPVFVVEGQIDSLFLPNSIAVGSSNLGMWNKAHPNVKSILVFDNEPSNKEIVKLIENAIASDGVVCSWLNCPFKGKDINKMIENGASIKEITKWILDNSHRGEKARLHLIEWKKNQFQ